MVYIWKYDNSQGGYKKLGSTVFCCQKDSEDIVVDNSLELAQGHAKRLFSGEDVSYSIPKYLPATAEMAGLDFLNPQLVSNIGT